MLGLGGGRRWRLGLGIWEHWGWEIRVWLGGLVERVRSETRVDVLCLSLVASNGSGFLDEDDAMARQAKQNSSLPLPSHSRK